MKNLWYPSQYMSGYSYLFLHNHHDMERWHQELFFRCSSQWHILCDFRYIPTRQRHWNLHHSDHQDDSLILIVNLSNLSLLYDHLHKELYFYHVIQADEKCIPSTGIPKRIRRYLCNRRLPGLPYFRKRVGRTDHCWMLGALSPQI